ncbi:hypothetical protein Taro_022514 [Colocasia esculenta]|uniref:Remorin C-terminal domain-containing protein n=1 Tax=Colocasia esculenta TaxID=4460 RepID=A0A843V5J4_COLES|nr:hypothetical protein [Colocasia esculenta]
MPSFAQELRGYKAAGPPWGWGDVIGHVACPPSLFFSIQQYSSRKSKHNVLLLALRCPNVMIIVVDVCGIWMVANRGAGVGVGVGEDRGVFRFCSKVGVVRSSSGKKDRESYITREGQTPPKKTVSFKEEKKESWYAKRLSRQISEVDEPSNYGFAAAIAAATYAVNSLQESSLNRNIQATGLQSPLTKTKSKKENDTDSHKPSRWFSGSKRFDGEQGKITSQNAAPIVKTPSLKTESGKLYLTNSGHTDTKADAWEKAELAKIQKRYEKTYSSLLEWESKKKTKARRRLEQNEVNPELYAAELQQERARAVNEYNEELAKINKIVAGARSVTDEKKKKDESKIKKKAYKIRSTGEVPRSCCCF